ncbi:MAG: beta-Ala-His dipeptidase [Halioglobus sp.]
MKPDDYPSDPGHLWQHFYRITQIPRPSKQEQAIRQYVIDQAEQAGCQWRTDEEGNLVVSVTASAAMQDRQTVIIQNHLDMVTVKTEDKVHDFSADPLSLAVNDGWLHADRTTLGADNGVGCAASLALMTDPDVEHPPLELLFTVDEETGLGGALNLDPDLMSGSLMLNLDTEDWQELFVGCAGGGGWQFRRDFETALPTDELQAWQLSLRGLAGGHSGIQIHEQLGNAIRLLAQCLVGIEGISLAAMSVGVAHNVIPREGDVQFAAPAAVESQLRERIEAVREEALGYLPAADAGLALTLEPVAARPALGDAESSLVLDALMAFPHGVQAYSQALGDELVDLSVNLAVAELRDGQFMLETSYRFFNEAQSVPLQQGILGLARAFGLTPEPVVGYPGWQPDFDSALLARAKRLHEQLFAVTPAVKAIHAGLECGILKGKKPDLEILSFGPTIKGAHSPTERLQIDTVKPFWQFLTALLREV